MSYRGDHGYRIYPSGLPDYQLDPPEPDEPELAPPDQERCDPCGELVCDGCGGCPDQTCEGRLCGCRAVTGIAQGIPSDRWQDALDDADDAAIDGAKVGE